MTQKQYKGKEKQESGGWQERFDKNFPTDRLRQPEYYDFTPKLKGEIKSFIKTELQKAERRGYEFARNEMIEDMEAVEEFFATAPIDYDDRKNMWIFLLNKLLKK